VKKVFYTQKKIEDCVNTIISEMNNDKFVPDYIIGITRGGLIPTVMISEYLNVPMYTLKISLRDDQYIETNETLISDAIGTSGYKKNILIVDDINDSGNTLTCIKENWEKDRLASVMQPLWNQIWGNNVKFAVLINNEPSKFKNIDYYGCIINKEKHPCWIVFPWENWWQ
jgi:hypoxanthine phosphoribosyltransferase